MQLIVLPRVKLSQYHTGHTLRAFLNTLLGLTLSYDLVHAFVFPVHPIAIPAAIVKIIRRKPLVIDGDDLWRGGWANYHPWPVKKQLEFCEDKLGFLADKITVVSEKMKNRFLEAGIKKEKIVKIPNGASVEEIKPMEQKLARKRLGLDDKSPLVLVMGHTFTEGLFIFLKAFAKVVKLNPGVKILFLGKMALSKEGEERLKRVSQEIGEKNIIFVGEKPFKEVPFYLGAADILALPMDDNPIEEARSPMRLGDYLASGRPIVANAVGEVKNVLVKFNCGLVSSPRNSDEFAQNIIKILEDKKLAKRLGRKARMVAENVFAWSHIAADLEKIYLKVLRKKQ
jgi:glycosyltransferase involved in cell wall biosynthesis